MKVLRFCFLFLFVFAGSLFAKTDNYDSLIREFSPTNINSLNKDSKIAIVPFTFVDKKEDTEGSGAVISERLITRIVNEKVYKIVDRQNLEDILKEQKLQISGIVDTETAKSLGKILGVDAVITGTMLNINNNQIELNAKLIKTETAEILAASSIKINKDWGNVNNINVPSKNEKPAIKSSNISNNSILDREQELIKKNADNKNNVDTTAFFDFFLLKSLDSSMELTFKNSNKIKPSSLGIDFSGDQRINNINFSDLETNINNGFGFRFLGFSNYIGFGFEVLSFNQEINKQETKWSYNNLSEEDFSFDRDDYLKVSTIAMDVGIYARFSKKAIQPYIGCNLGLTINSIDSPYIYSYENNVWQKGLDTTEVGFMVNFPIGIRILLGDHFVIFTEYMTMRNEVSFTRNISGEDDNIVLKNDFINYGVSFKF
jgi:TolB-like protein